MRVFSERAGLQEVSKASADSTSGLIGGREARGFYGLIWLSNIMLTFGVLKRVWFIIVYCSISWVYCIMLYYGILSYLIVDYGPGGVEEVRFQRDARFRESVIGI